MKTLTRSKVHEVITLADMAKADSTRASDARLERFIKAMPKEEQIELLALMWMGRDDAVDDPISYEEHVEYARRDGDENAAGYISEKVLMLGEYLRHGLDLLDDPNGIPAK